VRPRRFRRIPPGPDPYAAAHVSRTRVWSRGAGAAPLALWLLLFGLGVAAAVFLAVLLLTRDGGEEAPEGARTTTLPNLLNADHVEAATRLEELGLVVDTFPVPGDLEAGTVVAQSPGPASEVGRGSFVRLDVSLGPAAQAEVAVPDVTGARGREARRRLREAGFTVQTLLRDARSPEEAGTVILQQPAAGTRAPALSQVHLYVAR
jgi:beta-lactam-binding protein with PASTA domain